MLIVLFLCFWYFVAGSLEGALNKLESHVYSFEASLGFFASSFGLQYFLFLTCLCLSDLCLMFTLDCM